MKKVLVMGSVHLDILANAKSEFKDCSDRIGSLKYSVGGAAFNISANLISKNHRISIFTVQKEGTISSEIIEGTLNRIGFDKIYLKKKKDISESGYVAHLLDGKPVSAVSCMGIEYYPFEINDLKSLIVKYDLIVIDSNLSETALLTISDICGILDKELFLCNVSDSKTSRILSVASKSDHKKAFSMVSLNEEELRLVAERQNPNICDLFSSNYVVLTRGAHGYAIYHENKVLIEGSAPEIPDGELHSPLGAGDALFASLVDIWLEQNDFFNKDCVSRINEYIIPVLYTEAATPNSIVEMLSEPKKENGILSIFMLSFGVFGFSASMSPYFIPTTDKLINFILFVFTVISSGVTGVIIRKFHFKMDWDGKLLSNIVLGVIAAIATIVIYLVPQLLSVSTSISLNDKLLPFLFIIGLGAGLTSDLVFEKLTKKSESKVLEYGKGPESSD